MYYFQKQFIPLPLVTPLITLPAMTKLIKFPPTKFLTLKFNDFYYEIKIIKQNNAINRESFAGEFSPHFNFFEFKTSIVDTLIFQLFFTRSCKISVTLINFDNKVVFLVIQSIHEKISSCIIDDFGKFPLYILKNVQKKLSSLLTPSNLSIFLISLFSHFLSIQPICFSQKLFTRFYFHSIQLFFN
jgi:hypothetical protein